MPGAFGSGGQPGMGRKPKAVPIAFRHGKKGAKPAVERGPLPVVKAPKWLAKEGRAMWRLLAPFAREARTLTPATAESFAELCDWILKARATWTRIEADGLVLEDIVQRGDAMRRELKKHPLLSEYRGMMQRIEAGRARFCLAPFGKEVAVQEAPVDPFAEFEGRVQ